MDAKVVRVSAKGQIAIPVAMRRQIQLEEGDDLLLLSDGKRIVLEKVSEDRFADLRHHAQLVANKLWDNKEDEVWNDV